MQRRQQYRESQEVAEDSLKKIIAAFPRAIAGAICLSDMAQGRPFITVLTDGLNREQLTLFSTDYFLLLMLMVSLTGPRLRWMAAISGLSGAPLVRKNTFRYRRR